MDCPFLSKIPLNICTSTSDVLAHSLFSSDKCKGLWYTLCPLYRQQRSDYYRRHVAEQTHLLSEGVESRS
jgi:hypothetical protein